MILIKKRGLPNTEHYPACLFILISLNMIGVSIAFVWGVDFLTVMTKKLESLFIVNSKKIAKNLEKFTKLLKLKN